MIEIINKIFEELDFSCIELDMYTKFDANNYCLEDLSQNKILKILKPYNVSSKYRIKKYINNLKLFIPNLQSDKKEYFVVLNLLKPNIDDLNKLIQYDFNNIFEYIKNSQFYNSYMDKNISLIILLKQDGLINEVKLNKKIFDIEENKYNYKKYVITYKESQLEELKECCGDNESIINVIDEIIYSKGDFIEFKSNPAEYSIYNIISKLYIKLPFLKLNYKKEKIPSLKKVLEYELKLNGDNELVNKIINIEDIKSLNDEEIISIAGGIY